MTRGDSRQSESTRPIRRILAATDRSDTADSAARWAAELAGACGGELFLVQVVAPEGPPNTRLGRAGATRADLAEDELRGYATALAGSRGSARVLIDDDPATALCRFARECEVDTLVVGNRGMRGRKRFLLGNVPNQVSHNVACNVIIVNSATADTAPPVEFTGREDQFATVPPPLLGRAGHITAVMARHGVRELFGRRGGPEVERAQARRLRGALEELGPTFAKLGQVLSTRPDLLPPSFIEELSQLQDHVTPLGEEEVVAVMEEELGVPWEDVFSQIDPEPLAAGTIAQVHRATLESGDRVVIKVQRPAARDDIEKDLALLQLFAERTERRPLFHKVIDMKAVFEHLSDSLQRELDFRREAENIRRMAQILEKYPRLDVPEVYGDLSSPRLLVMEEIQGVAVRDAPTGRARREASRQLLESYYDQIMTAGFFHADPHPGNLLWWKDRIYFLDFGMVGEVGPDLRESMMLLLMAFWQEDVGFLMDVTLTLSGGARPVDLDPDRFGSELGDLLAQYRSASLRDIQLGPVLQEMTEIAIRHEVPLPASLTLTAKAMAQMQLTAAELDPELDPFEVAGDFLMHTMTVRIRDKLNPSWVFYESQKLKVRLSKLIEAVERATGAQPGPKPQVNFRAERLEEILHRTGRWLSLAMTASASLFTATRLSGGWQIGLLAVGGALCLRLLVDLMKRNR
jgi:ubiquinone biosynthesis protein